MIKLIASDKIYVSESKIPDSGRGVFAKVYIKKGEIIEICPVIEIPKNDFANINQSFLVTYFFSYGAKKDKLVIALGFGSIYNHTYEPNATYRQKEKEQIMEFVALEDIKKDEEITVNYNNGDPKDKTRLWF
jgi:SET domain-containing protein